jgi:hypothetical protein
MNASKGSVILLWLVSLALSACTGSFYLFSKGELIANDQAPQNIETSFDLIGNLIIVDVVIEGDSLRFLFDTGAPTVLHQEWVEKGQFKKLTSKSVRDSQGNIERLDFVRLPSIAFGGFEFADITAVSSDLKRSPYLRCLELDGILGANMMRYLQWEINYTDQILKAWPLDSFKLDTTGSYSHSFSIKSTYTPVIDLMSDSLKIDRITFDSGSGGMLSLGQKWVQHFDVDSGATYSFGYHSAGLYGSKKDTVYHQLAPFSWGDTTFSIPYELEIEKSARLLGSGFLKYFTVYMHWEEHKIWLKPKDSLKEYRVTTPITAFPQDSVLVVGKIVPDFMHGDLSVLALGDTIYSINGIDCSNVSGENFCAIFKELMVASSDTLWYEIKGKGSFAVTKRSLYQ